MNNEITKTIEWCGKTLEISTGKIARQADGAVMIKMGGSMVLCTVVAAKTPKEGLNFFPLTTNYREMAYAVGKIPGGFFKREGKPSEKEVLTSRLIDRPIRPLFQSGFFNETHIICTTISYDRQNSTDILAIIGASAALAISGLPFQETIAAARVGLIDNKFVVNPSFEDLKKSDLDLVVAGTESSIMMVESEANLLSQEQMLDAVKLGHESFQPVIKMIGDLAKEVGKQKWEVTTLDLGELKSTLTKSFEKEIISALAIQEKQARVLAFDVIVAKAVEDFAGEDKYPSRQVEMIISEIKSSILRGNILKNGLRIDGRRIEDIRQINGEVGLLPQTHGSALFTRGETQALVVTTLGTSHDEQIVDSLDGEYKESFMLNYIFPPYSVGEAAPLRAPGRREIGHGKLAWRALSKVMPSKELFPYSIRVVSEVTACNGSSSMATVCGSSMALMNAGVPIKTAIAGIAMGLIKEGDDYAILSDILGEEDALGDMDFKVAGSKDGITALQMDIKISGITFDIMSKALTRAQEGRSFILDAMTNSISMASSELSPHAPCMGTIKIDKDKIRDVIGQGGKVIREICESTSAKIDISEDGKVTVSAASKEKLDAAIHRVNMIAYVPKIGDVFDGKVVTVLESISFINYIGSKEGVLHISGVSHERIASLQDLYKPGDMIKVKVIGFDMKGKAKLVLANKDHQDKEPKPTSKDNKKGSKSWKNIPEDEKDTKPERKYFS
jgi:polyribonucleotide nucleotidyltransferase